MMRAYYGEDGYPFDPERARTALLGLIAGLCLLASARAAWLGYGATHLEFRGRGYQTALLAHVTGRPVKLVFTREEEFLASPTRQPVLLTLRSGCRKDGTLTFRQVHTLHDNGAYTSWGATTPFVMMQTFSSLYRVPHCDYHTQAVYTNNPYAGSFRGYGNLQATFAVEAQMDAMAEKIGMDPLAFRLKNAQVAGEVTGQGMVFRSCGFQDCLRTAAERIRHIPKILYHWRSVPGSTAMLIGAKSYATQAAEKVISEHFLRVGVNASISPTKGSYWRIHYPLAYPTPRVTLIIPTRNRRNVLQPCVESLLAKLVAAFGRALAAAKTAEIGFGHAFEHGCQGPTRTAPVREEVHHHRHLAQLAGRHRLVHRGEVAVQVDHQAGLALEHRRRDGVQVRDASKGSPPAGSCLRTPPSGSSRTPTTTKASISPRARTRCRSRKPCRTKSAPFILAHP